MTILIEVTWLIFTSIFLFLFINVQYISCGKYAIYFSAQPLFSAQTYYVYEFPCTHIPQSPNFMFSQGLLINLFLSFEKKTNIFSVGAISCLLNDCSVWKPPPLLVCFLPTNPAQIDFNLLSRCVLRPQMSQQDFYDFLFFYPPNFSNLCSLCRLMPAK